MKLSMNMFGKDGDEAPMLLPELNRMSRKISETLVDYMRLFAVSKVRLELEATGVVPTTTLKFEAEETSGIPDALKVIRPDILRGMVKTLMERFSIGEINIELSDDERAERALLWDFYKTGEAPEGYEMLNQPLQG